MRDLFVTLVVLGSLPIILYRPYIGILMWSWLGYMNPHKLTWDFARDYPFAMIVAIVTMIGFLFVKEKKHIPWTREIILLLVFTAWMLFTTLMSLNPQDAWLQWDKVWKIMLMTGLTLALMGERRRIILLVWVIALSLGFYGIKGGIFTIVTGGQYHVWGPAGTFIGGNNEIGLAMIMSIPLLRFLQLSADRQWVRIGLTAAILLSFVSILGTQSRGAFLGVFAMMLFLILKSRRRLVFGAVLAVAIPLVITIMPQEWYERMETIKEYQTDVSAMGRINAWWFAYNLAKDRPLVGGGFECFRPVLFARYAPNPAAVHDAHSIYFEVLGEHGFVGLALFLLLGAWTWFSASWTIKHARGDPGLKWAGDLSAMLQVSLVGYAVGGAFLGLAYFDLYYHLIAMVVLTKKLVEQRLAEKQAENAGHDGAINVESAAEFGMGDVKRSSH